MDMCDDLMMMMMTMMTDETVSIVGCDLSFSSSHVVCVVR